MITTSKASTYSITACMLLGLHFDRYPITIANARPATSHALNVMKEAMALLLLSPM